MKVDSTYFVVTDGATMRRFDCVKLENGRYCNVWEEGGVLFGANQFHPIEEENEIEDFKSWFIGRNRSAEVKQVIKEGKINYNAI